jgi:hypothetical protein
MIPGPRHDEHLRKEHAGTVGAGPRSVGPGACTDVGRTIDQYGYSARFVHHSQTAGAVQHNGRSEGSAVTH